MIVNVLLIMTRRHKQIVSSGNTLGTRTSTLTPHKLILTTRHDAWLLEAAIGIFVESERS